MVIAFWKKDAELAERQSALEGLVRNELSFTTVAGYVASVLTTCFTDEYLDTHTWGGGVNSGWVDLNDLI